MEEILKLRAHLSAAKKREAGHRAFIIVLLIICVLMGGALAYLFTHRDVPLINLSPDIRDTADWDRDGDGEGRDGPSTTIQQLTAQLPRFKPSADTTVKLPEESAIDLEKRKEIIEILDIFAKRDGIFSPCFPQDNNNSQVPTDVLLFLERNGFNNNELLYIQSRYTRIWNQHFRDIAVQIPGDVQSRLTTCAGLTEGWKDTEEAKRRLDNVDQLSAAIRRTLVK